MHTPPSVLLACILLLHAPVWAASPSSNHSLGNGQGAARFTIPPHAPSVPPGPWPASEFDCNKPSDSMANMICQDDGLSRLDNRLQKVFTQAMDKAGQQAGNPAQTQNKLLLEQRRWERTLRECMKSDNPHMCLGDTYILRITELQAGWELAPSLTPLHYLCGGNNNDVLATFYRTKPATARLVRGKSQVILHQQELVNGGARYAGQNVEFIIKGKEANLNWKGENLLCISQPEP